MQTSHRTHPLVIVAAATVSLFSLVGIGAVMGWIPTTTGQSASAAIPSIPEQPLQPEPPKLEHRAQPKPVSKSGPPRRETQVAAVVPPPPPPASVVVAAICHECAVVEDVRTVEKQGQASGVGAVGGAVVGGVLGHQVGAGRGKDLATVLGALGGGLGGNQIEKSVKTEKQYQVVVRYDDGRTGTITQTTPPAWHKGDKVKVIDGTIQANG